MKKLLFFLFAICFISCEGPEGPRGYDGKDGKDGEGVYWVNKTYTIKPSSWVLEGETTQLESYYYADVNISELDDDIYKWGTLIAYMETAPGVKVGMPYIRHYGVPNEEPNSGNYLWTETYDFDYTVGSIRFYLTYSDFATDVKPSEDIKFHVVIIR